MSACNVRVSLISEASDCNVLMMERTREETARQKALQVDARPVAFTFSDASPLLVGPLGRPTLLHALSALCHCSHSTTPGKLCLFDGLTPRPPLTTAFGDAQIF
eukprot:6181195-Pleurochrysis_carterae.AAC.1